MTTPTMKETPRKKPNPDAETLDQAGRDWKQFGAKCGEDSQRAPDYASHWGPASLSP